MSSGAGSAFLAGSPRAVTQHPLQSDLQFVISEWVLPIDTWAAMSGENLGSSSVLKRLAPVLALIALCWAVFVLNNLILDGQLNQYGIRPRHIGGLPGINSQCSTKFTTKV